VASLTRLARALLSTRAPRMQRHGTDEAARERGSFFRSGVLYASTFGSRLPPPKETSQSNHPNAFVSDRCSHSPVRSLKRITKRQQRVPWLKVLLNWSLETCFPCSKQLQEATVFAPAAAAPYSRDRLAGYFALPRRFDS